jgi:hypothetical protein
MDLSQFLVFAMQYAYLPLATMYQSDRIKSKIEVLN